jgi:hypothetical protein
MTIEPTMSSGSDYRREMDQLRHDVGENASVRLTVVRIVGELEAIRTRQDAEIAWMNTMKGGLAAMGLLLGIVSWLYLDVRNQLGGKVDSATRLEMLERLNGDIRNLREALSDAKHDREAKFAEVNHHLEAIDARYERLVGGRQGEAR